MSGERRPHSGTAPLGSGGSASRRGLLCLVQAAGAAAEPQQAWQTEVDFFFLLKNSVHKRVLVAPFLYFFKSYFALNATGEFSNLNCRIIEYLGSKEPLSPPSSSSLPWVGLLPNRSD